MAKQVGTTRARGLRRGSGALGALVLGAAMVVGGAGCRTEAPATTIVGYRGPTLTVQELVGRINANNAKIPSLWSRHYFEGDIVDDKGKRHFVNAEGILLVMKPRQMRLVGKKDIAGTVFDLGTDGERYWMSVPVEVDTMWWGYNKNIGKPCAKGMPVQPEAILQVLGVGDVETNLMEPPVPVMRFNADADAYMVVWNQPLGDHWAATKEVWYDRKTLVPRLVLLFDRNGRVILRAYPEKPGKVELEGKPEDQWPTMATSYRLFFPESGSKITIQLREMKLENDGVPNERSIVYPSGERAGVSKEIQIDQDCGQ